LVGCHNEISRSLFDSKRKKEIKENIHKALIAIYNSKTDPKSIDLKR
jgi:hypothetical protein